MFAIIVVTFTALLALALATAAAAAAAAAFLVSAATATSSADAVAQADAWFALFFAFVIRSVAAAVAASAFVPAAVLALRRIPAEGVLLGRVGAAAGIGAGAGAGAAVVRLLVLRPLFLSFRFTFRVFILVVLLEFANFDLDVVAFNSQSNGQLGGASLEFRGGVQDLIRVVGFQSAADDVALGFLLQALSLGANQRELVIVSRRISFNSDDKAVTVAVRFRVVNFIALFERE